MRTGAARGDGLPRVLVLASDPRSLTVTDLGGARDLPLRITVACVVPVPEGAVSLPVRRLRPTDGLRPFAPRTLAARAGAAVVARRERIPARPLWAVKSDPWARRALRESDVVVSADPVTDRVLGQVPDLLADAVVVPSWQSEGLWAALRSLERVLASDPDAGEDETDERLAPLVDPTQAQIVPPTLLPTSRAAHTIRCRRSAPASRAIDDPVIQALGHFRWEGAPDVGTTGLAARLAALAVEAAADEALFPAQTELAEVVDAALTGADEALAAGERGLARARLSDAMALLFHRERHAETLHSPLVSDPAGYLASLYANRTFRDLVAGGTRPRLKPWDEHEDGISVLALGGVYGDFHAPVVEALADAATVSFRSPRRLHRFFGRRGVDPQLLDALAGLRGHGPEAWEDEWSVRELTTDLRRSLVPRLRRSDVVFTDWVDRSTVWVSHLVPADCRLVVRVHSLDALDPFFHLVDWSAVEEVIVVSEPLRRLVVAMLQAAGADVPVTVVANLAELREADLPKAPGARTTLGMVGWGRRVKDPLWALDLLARDPAWRLVLIGPDLPGRSASAKAYLDEVHRRLQDPALRDRVEVVGQTDDVATHLRKVGVILSTSRRESWHLGLVEGAASGAVPVVRNWPIFAPVGGARSLFPQEWVVETLDEAEERIRALTGDPDVWEEARLAARQDALALFDPTSVAERYRQVVLGPLRPR